MANLTLSLAILFAFIIIYLKPIHAFAFYLIQLYWYPDYLIVSVGTIDISVSRVVIFVLLAKLILNPNVTKYYKHTFFDTWIILSMIVYVGVFLITRPFNEALENRAGWLMDSWFVYLSARLSIRSVEDLTKLLKILTFTIVPLAIIAGYESFSGNLLFYWLRKYCPWDNTIYQYHRRLGLTRAYGPFSHPIMLGSAFFMFIPLLWTLRYDKKWRKYAIYIILFAGAGSFFTISSSVLGTLIVVFFGVYIEKYPKVVKVMFYTGIVMVLSVAVFSTTPVYRWFLSRGAIGGGGWEWRSRLIECCLRDFKDWWLLGYKGIDPGWGFEGYLEFTDLTNEFIAYGVYYGIWGVIALAGTLFIAYRIAKKGYINATCPHMKSLNWGFGNFIVSLLFCWTGVSFFSQPVMLFYAIMGIIGSSQFFVFKNKANKLPGMMSQRKIIIKQKPVNLSVKI